MQDGHSTAGLPSIITLYISYSTNSPDRQRELQHMFAIIFIQIYIHRFGSYDLWHNFLVHFMKYPFNLSNNTRPNGHNM